jgi:tripartite-type tricarboxylate transporter receptor subunit TctC
MKALSKMVPRVKRQRRGLAMALVFAATLGMGANARAQAQAPAWPSKPVKLVIPAPGGSAADLLARMVGERFTALTGQPMVIDLRPGADGALAAVAAARSDPDGHTLLLGNAGIMTVNPHFNAKLAYDPVKDFEPISLLVNNVIVLTVRPALGVNTVQELVAASRAKPGTINYASVGGRGGVPFLSGQLLRQQGGADLTWVGYASEGQARSDLMSGQIQVMFDTLASSLPLVQSGRLKILAVTGGARAPQLPQVPTLIESGFPGVQGVGWLGLYAPAATPAAALVSAQQLMAKIFAHPELRERMLTLGMEPVASTTEALVSIQRGDHTKWGKLIKDAGIKPE